MKTAAVDIGGTNIKTALCIEPGKLTEELITPTEAKKGGKYVMEKVISLIERFGEIDGIGISSAGQIDTVQGSVIYANKNLPEYTGMPVKRMLEEHFRVPVTVENDVNAAAIGEGAYGAAKGVKNYLCLTYGTGVGGAAVIDGKLYRGRHGCAGEFGHMILYPGGKRCACGGRGCYEQYASVKSLLKLSAPAGAKNGHEVIERLRRNDYAQESAVWQWTGWVADGLATLEHIFDAECIVLGGGIMESGELAGRIETALRQRLMPVYRDVEVRRAALGNQAGMLGAAYQIRRLLNG